MLAVAQGGACVQAWPAKPIRLIVPMPPAGTTDNMGRLAGQKLADILGQPVIVENRAGANGNIGSDYVSKSVPGTLAQMKVFVKNEVEKWGRAVRSSGATVD